MKFLLILLLLLPGPLAAQHGHRYWDAPVDSLRRVLARQHTDAARLRTLQHLTDLAYLAEPESRELVRLATHLRPSYARLYRLLYVGERGVNEEQAAAALDSMQAAIEAFDRLNHPVPLWLNQIRWLFSYLKRPAARQAYYQRKLAAYRAQGAEENAAMCYHLLGGAAIRRGDYNQGISLSLRATDLFRTFSLDYYSNELQVIGSYYARWGNDAKALEYLRQSLAVNASWSRRGGPKPSAFVYSSIARVYRQQHNYPAALRHADQALAAADGSSYDVFVHTAVGLQLKSAILLDQHRVAEAGSLLARAQRLADSLEMPLGTQHGDLELDATWARYYAACHDDARAEAAWLRAYRQARKIKSAALRQAYLRELSAFYGHRGQPGPAARYAQAALALTDSLAATERAFRVANYETTRVEETQRARIATLRRAQHTAVARARQQRLVLWAVLGGAALLLLLAGVLWNRFRFQRRATRAITREKQRSDELLLNILPAEVAEELKDTGKTNARHFDLVTVLFADVAGFTQLSEKLTPQELVATLDTYFGAFDAITGRFGLEKIKTIGDAYMLAGGLGQGTDADPAAVVRAALAMQHTVEAMRREREPRGLPCFRLRIGLHTGPVVAGVVGVKKFAYDIWGDTVNTAARMESSGAAGRVNISEDTYTLVGERFVCEARGKLAAKHKGEIGMYFVEAERGGA